MRKLVLAILAGGAAMLPATAQAGSPTVRDGPHPVPNVSIRAPHAGAGVGWKAPMQHRAMRHDMRRGHHRGGVNGFPGYRVIHRGGVVPGYWWGPRYGIGNWGSYGFGQPTYGTRWVRYYDDALLIDRDGRVRDGRYGMDWDRYGDDWGHDDRGIPVYTGDGDYYPEDRDYDYAERFERDGGGRELDYDRDYPYDHRYGRRGGGYAYGYGGGGYTVTETTVTSAPTVVETVEYVTVHRPQAKRHHKPRKHSYRAKAAPRCYCK